jgi:AAA domain
VRRLELPAGGDVVDWLRARHNATAVDLAELPRVPRPAAARDENDGAWLRLRCVSDIEARPVRWLWPGRIARGKVSLLAGHPGLGKSQVGASMAAIVTTAGLWPVDRTRCDRGRVVIFSAEDDPEDTIRPRLEAAGADLTRCHVFETVEDRAPNGTPRRRPFSLASDLPRLSAALAELPDVALVLIDPITAYLGDTDSHKNADVRAVLAALAEVAAKHSVAIVAVSHLRKSGAGDALLQVTGSLAFVAAARAAYVIAKDKDDPQRRLMLPIKNNLGEDQTGYAFSLESFRLPGGIDTSRVIWEAESVAVTADEALAPAQATQDGSATDEATDWLRERLARGAMKVSDIDYEAKQAGIKPKPLRSARERLQIVPKKAAFAGGWEWALPGAEDAQHAQGAPTQGQGIFAVAGHLRHPSGSGHTTGPDSEVL